MRQSFYFLALLSVCYAQKLIDLKTFRGGNQQSPIDGTGTFAIYVSASADSPDLLKRVMLHSKNLESISMNDLKNHKLLGNSGELQPYAVTGPVYVTSDLTDDQMNRLTGFMFVSSAAQLKNKNFFVIDMSQSTRVALKTLDSSTVLFMNSNINSNKPDQSTMISSWDQTQSSFAYLYEGIPTDSVETKNTQIFSNPIHTYNFDHFFSNVEKFSLNLGTFYLKTSNGGVNFNVQPGNVVVDGTTTTAFSTTGFYMKQMNQPDESISINTKRDTSFSGIVGANIYGSVPSGGKVEVGQYDGAYHDSMSVPPQPFINYWSSPHIGQTFKGSSSNTQAGEYFVQYFVLQGAANTGTTQNSVRTSTARNNVPTAGPINPTSGHFETTTRSSGAIEIFAPLLIIAARLL